MLLRLARSLITCTFVFWGHQTLAVSYTLASTGGLMQQPASHYYHAIYGLQVTAGSDSQGILIRSNYIERPAFKELGFSDQDRAGFVLIGTQVLGKPLAGLRAFLGAGQFTGKVSDSTSTYSQSRHYKLQGITTTMEYRFHLAAIEFSVNHQHFLGYGDMNQLNAYVAWPFTIFQSSIGYTW